ncbi:PilC/PilY family type IV pilus protein [Luteimonas sp. SMYT11W]|uniref:PilC/PilY family type IV pilus protein n=1 Tax=Luteimonas flava TaxID=3115822 RepID=A0ABU7W9W1_9GAMM
MKSDNLVRYGTAGLLLAGVGLFSLSLRSDPAFFAGAPPPIAQSPLYMRDAVPPLNMLVMGKDHKIYYEAYNDASDLDGDGVVDVGYKGWERKQPAPTEDGVSRFKIDYYGYFNSYACYTWQSTRFVAVAEASDKTCNGQQWSGDFLNYLSTSRMDALRRVLYGGFRQVDDDETVLQGAFFPQDAHSWGKEYQSLARDGYNIANYAPLSAPPAGRYHLFAVTTLTDSASPFPAYQAPMLRVLKNSPFRVWNWLSIEGPVAGNRCFTESNQRVDCVGAGGSTAGHPGHPANRSQFDAMETSRAVPANLLGSGSVNQIDCNGNNCNPYGSQDNFLTIFTGVLRTVGGGGMAAAYQFKVDGDDAIDFALYSPNGNLVPGSQIGCYNGRGFGAACAGTQISPNIILSSNTEYTFKFRHEEANGSEGYQLQVRDCTLLIVCGAWRTISTSNVSNMRLQDVTRTVYNLAQSVGGATRDDYYVRVLACPPDRPQLQDTSCKVYPDGSVKPTGILHDYGESNKMYFGLITGSQRNNLEGGLLRRNISSFADEVDPRSGRFRSVNGQPGIARSIDRLRMIGGGYDGSVQDNSGGDSNWNWANRSWIGTNIGQNCPSQGDRDLANGECRMWGNPIGEMLFESMRYFAGANEGTARFTARGNTNGNAEDEFLGLPEPQWRDPYSTSQSRGLGYPACSRPYQTVISDINPSYDGQMPGSAFGTFPADAAVPGFSASAEGQTIWNAEYGGQRDVFIGQVGTAVVDGAPTAKSVSSMGNIRGLSPEEPSKGGTYYSASVARFGRNNSLNAAADPDVRLSTYSIALASPLPRIEFPVGGRTVTLLPFAKTASGTFGGGTRKPTNTIVDFYVETIENFPGTPVNTTVNGGRPYAVFRINYEDVEQGNDHDMDAIVRYEVAANANNTISVNLTSEYAAGSADQNMGYVLSGTTQDGIYLVVRDSDSTAGSFRPYDLNTPPGVSPGGCRNVTTGACNQQLPLRSERTFTPSTTGSSAIQLRDPLWYAAKYGAPDPANWDTSPPGTPGAGDPDNYFLVTNPLNLRNQLAKAFDDIASRGLDAGSRTIVGARIGAESFTLQPTFQRDRNGKDWTGNLTAIALRADGTLGSSLWNARAQLPVAASRNVRTITNVRDGTSTASTGVTKAEFQAANLGTTNADRLGKLGITAARLSNGDYGSGAYTADDFVAYLRGDQSRELGRGTGATLRARSSVIGSIVNSEPVVAAPRSDLGYGNVFRQTSDAMFAGYASNTDGTGYLDIKRTRPAVAYVGANDGMLHAFNAATTPCALDPTQTCAGANAGREAFAFIPNAVLGNLGQIPVQDARYEHRYFVDGQISIGDVKSGSGAAGSAWKTVLVGSTGGGARSIFALDISSFSTDPTSATRFSDANVLWERNDSVDGDLGHIYGKPLIVPLENGQWGVIFGNGYGGRRSDPSLYVLNAMTGAVIAKLTADDGQPARQGGLLSGLACGLRDLLNLGACNALGTSPYNGLGQVTAIDRSGNGKVDTIYGGDLQGNLWKFDISSGDASAWNVANSGRPLFTAELPSGERQPITGGMRITAGPGTGVMVYFGTGRYLFGGPSGDNNVPANPTVQSLYAVFDNGTRVANGRSDLQVQTITGTTDSGGNTTRSISRTRVIYNGTGAKRGWYLDLQVNTAQAGQPASYSAVGERFIATPRIQSGRVFFTTFTPSEDSCNPGGDNFVYGLDLLSGSGALANVQVLPSQTPACTGADCGAIRINQGGAPVTSNSVAAINPLVPITTPAPGSCTPGVDCPTFEQCQVVVYPGAFVLPRPCGRQSWRQLR